MERVGRPTGRELPVRTVLPPPRYSNIKCTLGYAFLGLPPRLPTFGAASQAVSHCMRGVESTGEAPRAVVHLEFFASYGYASPKGISSAEAEGPDVCLYSVGMLCL